MRKYFRTQLGAVITIPMDYVEYMIGHMASTYNDIQMKGTEYLRNLYAFSGSNIRPKTKITEIERIRMLVEPLGLNPDEIPSRDTLTIPHSG